MSKSAYRETVSAHDFQSPKGYKGIYAFHKYWGKKPVECMSYIIEKLSNPGDLVVDPFLGYGIVAREALLRGRRFVGCDINPISIELCNLLINLPKSSDYAKSVERLEENVKDSINASYLMENGEIATHFLWEGDYLKTIWQMTRGRNGRKEFVPTDFDINQINQYANYEIRILRPLHLFQNARINANPTLNLHDFFTGRALRNIELILEQINAEPIEDLRRALKLTLTAAIGQMSKMVFVITRRGKNNGATQNGLVQVGSWVIGFWRPELHFELNVWNCFQNKAQKLLKGLKEAEQFPKPLVKHTKDIEEIVSNDANIFLETSCAMETIDKLPDSSINLLVTDPPHSDRMPYLELSEIWNSVLGQSVDFNKEIVISNAKNRGKDKEAYINEMTNFFKKIAEKLADGGYAAVLFNARHSVSWNGLRESNGSGLRFLGCFPMAYSAGSVVQDNRKGSLKYDYVLVYQKNNSGKLASPLNDLPGWSNEFPS